ncbi:MAG: hypothetical protein F7B59_01320, partial [Desulfurococcales archaeon]|nr:hypothetical protein [Desulfurococcales archaeon]MCE4614034.1 hypothetical protein [Desulfurococcales archaeon]
LILVRSIQLYGRSEYVKAMGFLFVGWALGLILMILNVLVIFADVLDAYYPLLWGESVEGWCLANDPWGISPYLILGIFAIPIYWSNAGIKRMLRGIIPK